MKNNSRGYIDFGTVFAFGFIAAAVAFFLFLVVAVVGFPGGINPNYSEGNRVGVVNKLSYKGLVFKSYEAEASLTGLRKGSDSDGNTTVNANVFPFNVDPQAYPAVKEAMESGKPVNLHYRQWFVVPIGISNGHVVYKVEPVK